MNKRQLSVWSMSNTTLTHFDKQVTAWNNLIPVTDSVNEVRVYVNAISQQGLTQADRNTIGYTSDKNAQKNVMCDLALSLILKVRPYARKNANNVLLQAVDYSDSDLRRGPEADTVHRCQIIHDKSQEYVPKLGDYQVTTGSLVALQTAIDTFSPMTSQRDAIGKSRVTTSANLEVLFDKLRASLLLLDDLVPGMVTDQDFVATYRKVRVVDNPGARKRKPPKPKA